MSEHERTIYTGVKSPKIFHQTKSRVAEKAKETQKLWSTPDSCRQTCYPVSGNRKGMESSTAFPTPRKPASAPTPIFAASCKQKQKLKLLPPGNRRCRATPLSQVCGISDGRNKLVGQGSVHRNGGWRDCPLPELVVFSWRVYSACNLADSGNILPNSAPTHSRCHFCCIMKTT